ncbi:MAG: tRNA pseudouridine(55) synthase TruB [Bacteroidetes bacterium]|nr:tRNA pseudouridine(55) synthase TruB [Bacteroidota bacterium]
MTSASAPPHLRPPPVVPNDWNGSVLLVDKPLHWSSFKVVERVRALTGVRKVGHAGTLDPLATGLLIILVGRPATRHMESFMRQEKTYVGTLRLGGSTDSYDAELPVTPVGPWAMVSTEALDTVRQQFVGTIVQRPPMYAAIKVDGERLYKKARRGEEVEVPERTVTVHSFDVLEHRGPDVTFRVRCSKGTYVRSLAHDLGQALGVGAYLSSLVRTGIGKHQLSDAWTMGQLTQAVAQATPSA